MKTLSLFFKPSYLLATILSLFSLVMWLIVLIAPIAMLAKVALLIAGLLACAYAVSRYALLLLPDAITQLDFNTNNEIRVVTKDKRELKAELLADSFVSPWLTILNLKLAGRFWQHQLLILPDSLSPELFRQLRVRLLWSRHPAISDDTFGEDFLS